MRHPGIDIADIIKEQGRTQKKFAFLAGKKVSEVNELIKGKRNITIQWDYLLHKVIGTERRYRIDKQIEYDYELFINNLLQKEEPKEIKNEESKEIPMNTKENEILEETTTNIGEISDTNIDGKEISSESEDEVLKEKMRIFKEF